MRFDQSIAIIYHVMNNLSECCILMGMLPFYVVLEMLSWRERITCSPPKQGLVNEL